jgi:hypothetical protein
MLFALRAHLAGVEPDQAAWLGSPKARELTGASVRAWVAAHEAAGADADTARAAGEQTLAFYDPQAAG